MLFHSLQYAIFLPIVFAAYWLLPHRFRWPLLLAASYYFYMSWNVKYVFLILFTTVISYGCGLLLEKCRTTAGKKALVAGALVLCLGVLIVFKYLGFILDSVNSVASLFSIQLHPVTLNLMLPVGISFYTFQTLSYVIDVYRGDIAAEKHFGIYATFVSFFPQLVAGPIERPKNLIPQIRQERVFDFSQASYGLKLMAWGFFKKLAVADNVSVLVDRVYNDLHSASGFSLILATIFFAIQIYCDFSAYTDIARGTSKLLGIELMENFKSPYFSTSIKEFWSRWHISLSTWFRDYLYIPLGGNRVSKPRHYFNLIVTFLLSGLWHGANLTFIVWGAIHGVAQVIENMLHIRSVKNRKSFLCVVRIALVFIFVTAAWVFFRAQNISDALYVFRHAFDGITSPINYVIDGVKGLHPDVTGFLYLCLISLPLLVCFDFFSVKHDVIAVISARPAVVRWTIYVAFIMLILALMNISTNTEFIYFQF